MNLNRRIILVAGALLLGFSVLFVTQGTSLAQLSWKREWPKTDFSKKSIDLSEIMSGGPPKDGIPSIDKPRFVRLAEVSGLADTEPVVGLIINGKARAYPLRILTWHEIVNDELAGVPVTITYCPLCNSAIAFDRRLDGKILDFGTTGKLRKSDMVMYDRQTESWWQQFMGEGIVGEMTGKRLKTIPARLESFANFKKRAPDGEVLVPNDPGMRNYGRNPYAGYDSASMPFLFQGDLPKGISPMVRVIVIDGEAWSMPLLRQKGTLSRGNLTLSWEAGQNSALDAAFISKGRDVGNVVAQRTRNGKAEDVVYDVTFAFVYNAFFPDKKIHTN
ncbi:MAG: DUF3179 domain-containing protein [Proteobacteria bacterium]|nr:DUF3179 domain-containing protein [Pseudomonadota bacterium]MDA1022684.1 DUF3179 domain-containing protein [Pseudomonadota bacterium]